MITLTDGTKTVELSKDEMEMIEDGLRRFYDDALSEEIKDINTIFDKLRGLKYE